jgi:hypothetical protein
MPVTSTFYPLIRPQYYHMNLCTFPGSWDHSNPRYRNTYPVTALMSKNQNVSPHNRPPPPSAAQNLTTSENLARMPSSLLLLVVFFREGRDEIRGDEVGTCSRHTTHGMIKYRGSTSGAVISERAVERTNTSRKEVLGPSGCSCGRVLRRLVCNGAGDDGFESARYVRQNDSM